jgi:hypothetical protein
MKTILRQLKPYFCQTHQHKADRLTPYLRQTQAPPDLTTASLPESPLSELQIAPCRMNSALVQSSVTGIAITGVDS